METIIQRVEKNKDYESAIEKAAEIIIKGGIVAFPTETVYGLGADALNEEAALKIYEAKGRPSDNPLIIHISDFKQLKKLTCEIDEKVNILANKFWPGPLTLILKKSEEVPYSTTGGLDTVAIRMPDNLIALRIIEKSGRVIAAPSANLSGRPSPTNGRRVIEDLNGKIDMIIDAGDVEIGLESTILDLTGVKPIILRPGAVTKKMIEDVIGEVDYESTINNKNEESKPKAPGMKYRHYAPKAKLTMVKGKTEDEVIKEINRLSTIETQKNKKVGIISSEETKDRYTNGIVLSLGKRKNDENIAKNLYEALRRFDDLEVDCIFTETFEDGKMGKAIMNRLTKASDNNIVKL